MKNINGQQWLLENGFTDVVTNSLMYPENTQENASKCVYVSDILNEFIEKECNSRKKKVHKFTFDITIKELKNGKKVFKFGKSKKVE